MKWDSTSAFFSPHGQSHHFTFLLCKLSQAEVFNTRILTSNSQITPAQTRTLTQLQRATLVITNFQSFVRRETVKAGRLTKEILAQNGNKEGFVETNDQMVRRVCRALGNRKNIIVNNDEAHHCYRHKAKDRAEVLKGDERQEAEKREEQARIWINGFEAVKAKMGIKVVYDLSATPFFLKGSGYPEGTLFGWVVSDFSLTDAIESGIVKVPRVPVADDVMDSRMPVYREIWPRIREDLPKKGRRVEAVDEEPKLPPVLEGAIIACTSITKASTKPGKPIRMPFIGAADLRSSLSYATTPTFPAWFTTTSQAGVRSFWMAPSSRCPANCRCSAMWSMIANSPDRAYTESLTLAQAAGDDDGVLLATARLGKVQEVRNQLHLAAETYQRALQLIGENPIPFATVVYLGLARSILNGMTWIPLRNMGCRAFNWAW